MKLPRPIKRTKRSGTQTLDPDFVMTIPTAARCKALRKSGVKAARSTKPLDLRLHEPRTVAGIRTSANQWAANGKRAMLTELATPLEILISAATGAPPVSDGDTRISRHERGRNQAWFDAVATAARDVKLGMVSHTSLVKKIESYAGSEVDEYLVAFNREWAHQDTLVVSPVVVDEELRTLEIQLTQLIQAIKRVSGAPDLWPIDEIIDAIGPEPTRAIESRAALETAPGRGEPDPSSQDVA